MEQRRPRGSLEHEVRMVLAAAEEALTPAQVRDAMGDDLAYTTVMTVLVRLHAKGLVRRERAGRAYTYRWVADGAELTAHQMGRLLDGVDDRAAALARFVDVLSAADSAMLADLLNRDEPVAD